MILVGGIDGTFKGNRHLVFPDNTQRTSNMLLSITCAASTVGRRRMARHDRQARDEHGAVQPLEMV